MRKLIIVVLVALVSFSAFAEGHVSFTPLSQVPLYREPIADPYSYTSHLNVVMATDPDQRPNQVYSIITKREHGTDNYINFYDYLKYNDDALNSDNNKYFNLKTGVAVGLMRVRFDEFDKLPSIDLEFNIGGYLNTIFCLFGKNDTLDFDGSYLIGGSLRIADRLSFRFGIHHFSGHYGDEMLDKYYTYNQVNNADRFNEAALFNYANAETGYDYYLEDPVEYVRDNSWIFGMSADVPTNGNFSLRVYGEAELPKNPSWFRPLAHVPADYKNPVDEEERPTMIDRIGGHAVDGEQFPQEQLDAEQALKRTANGKYKGWRITLVSKPDTTSASEQSS